MSTFEGVDKNSGLSPITLIGANDYWIAAQALATESVLVTNNVGELSRVSGLTLENWLEAM